MHSPASLALQSDNTAWQLVQAAAAAARGTIVLEDGRHYALDGETLKPVLANDAAAVLAWHGGWQSLLPATDARSTCLDLYLPLASARGTAPMVLGQLGQSIDGSIATASGHSHYVTGKTSILHLHRLRALSDCVIVGAGTVAADDPRLTTRLVSGANPVRVVLDPQLRLPAESHVFSDTEARTVRVHAADVRPSQSNPTHVETLPLPALAGKLDLSALLAELQARGYHVILVEGGGVTVSAFLEAGLLDRIHIAVAPFILGAGRPGLRIPSPAHLQECLRPPPRIYLLGDDVLFDCDLRSKDRTENEFSAIRRVTPARP